jgi:uncharacterized protein
VPRKAFQDSPTPAGNPMAAIALLRLFAYTDETKYREKAERTILGFAPSAAKYGIFVATYGLAGVRLSSETEQVVVVGDGPNAENLFRAAIGEFSATRMVMRFEDPTKSQLPPALRVTIPHVARMSRGEGIALVCSGSICSPPVSNPKEISERLHRRSA